MVEVYLDSASIPEMTKWSDKVRGFTTNPTLMRKANIADYKNWAQEVISRFPDKPISFEVIADDFSEMERQARLLASWGPNVYVKIPITNTKGESSIPLIAGLSSEGIKVNVTGVMTTEQISEVNLALPAIISIFAGRIQDTGTKAPDVWIYGSTCLWASSRSLWDLYLAKRAGYKIITMTPDLIAKLDMKGKDLTEFSRETVAMFYNDAMKAGYQL